MDFRHCSRYDIEAELDKLITKEIDEIYIIHVVSMDFLEMFNLEAADVFEDFNGWQCDWWGSMEYKGIKIRIAGGAIYGTISLYLDEEEE